MESLVLTRLSKTPQPKFERAKKVGKSLKVLGAEDIQDIPQDFQEPTLQEKIDALEVGDGKVQSKERTEMSLSQLLSQAIHSDDIELLEKALSVADRNMINATIRRLSPTQVLPLLDKLLLRLQKNPNRAHHLVDWIRSCLVHHSGFLISVPQFNLGSSSDEALGRPLPHFIYSTRDAVKA